MPRAIPRLNLAPQLLFVVIFLVLFAITQVLLLIGLLQHNQARDAARNSAPQSRATVAHWPIVLNSATAALSLLRSDPIDFPFRLIGAEGACFYGVG